MRKRISGYQTIESFLRFCTQFKMRVIVGNSENLSLISSRYIVWKYRDFLQLPCVLLPPLGTILAMVIEVRKYLHPWDKMN